MLSGINTKLKRWNETSGTWENVGVVNTITLDGISREVIEVNRLNSQDGYVRKLKGLLNSNSFSANLGFTREWLETMKADIEDDANIFYAIVIPDEYLTTVEFEGFPTELPMDFNTSDEINMDMTFEIDGKIDIASGGASSQHPSTFG